MAALRPFFIFIGMSITISNTSLVNGLINPPLTTDQLVLMYDVGNPNSYQSGTALTNMAPPQFSNEVNGTLDNASMVVRPTNAHPYIQLETDDGANLRRIALDSTISLDTDDDSRTLSIWFWSNYNATGQYAGTHALLGGKYTNYWAVRNTSATTYTTEAETNGGTIGNHDYFSNGEGLLFGAWNNWTVVWDSGDAQNYINGAYAGNTYEMNTNSVFSFNRIGSTSTGNTSNDRGGTWRLGGFLLYNKALSQTELDQNHQVFLQKFNRG